MGKGVKSGASERTEEIFNLYVKFYFPLQVIIYKHSKIDHQVLACSRSIQQAKGDWSFFFCTQESIVCVRTAFFAPNSGFWQRHRS